MNILFLSRWFPYPADNGSRLRIFNSIKQLASRHEVTLISFAAEPVAEESITALGQYCRSVEIVPYRPFQPDRRKALLGFFSRHPRSVIDTFSAEMQACVDRVGRAQAFDLVIASQIDMASYALGVRAAARVFEEVELTVLYEQFAKQRHPLKRLRAWLTWWKLSHYAADLLRRFDGCTVVSEQERERVLQVAPGAHAIEIVPNGVDIRTYDVEQISPTANTLIYAGALTYGANFDAMDFFLREIFPLIRKEQPDVRLSITGRLDGVPIDQLLIDEHVCFTGYLDDIRPAVARSWASVVPLRIGSGTRLKILESLALGTPVITTSKGAEGLDLVPGRDILIADTPTEFAASVSRLLHDAELRGTLSRNGRQAVAAIYDWHMIGQRLNDFIEAVAAQVRQAPIQLEAKRASSNRSMDRPGAARDAKL